MKLKPTDGQSGTNTAMENSEAAAHLAAIVGSSDDAIIGKDLRGIVTSWNAGAEKIFGYAASDMIGQSISRLIAPERQLEEEKILAEIARGESVRQFETVRLRKGGSAIAVSITVSPIKDPMGEIIGASKVVRDITERRQTETALGASEKALGASEKARGVSEKARGVSEKARGVSEKALGVSEKALGVSETVLSVSEKARGASETALGASETALGASELRYRRLFESAKDGILILDADTGRVVDVNPFLITILGFSHEQFLGKAIWELGFFKDVWANADKFAELKEKEYVRYEHLPLETSDGRKIEVEFVSNVYLVNGSKVIQCNVRDVTARRRAEEALEQLTANLERRVIERTAELEAANEELEAFSYTVSHDLRAPLRAIDGYSRIFLEDHNDRLDDDGRRVLGVIRSESRRMGQLIDELLEFSRVGRQTMEPREIDMNALAEAALKELRAADPGRNVPVQMAPLPPTHGEPLMLRQVWANLLSNAVKFTRHREQPRIEVGASHENGETVYFVRDNGAGFDMAHYRKLFGVFQRLHGEAEFEGTGVGLAFVKRIIQRHGGRVWAESAIDQGATFYFALPDQTEKETTP